MRHALAALVSLLLFGLPAVARGQQRQPTEPQPGNLMPPEEPPPPADPTPSLDPAKDQQKLVQQGKERPTADGSIGASPSDVYAEGWWANTRPMLEMHGYFRTRGELFHNFALTRHTAPGQDDQNLWALPVDHSYDDLVGNRRRVNLCGDPVQGQGFGECISKTQSTANLRLRLNPEIHISDNLRIMSQIDLLDNLVLGSTPDAYALQPSGIGATGYNPAINGYSGYQPLGAFATNQGPPTAGVNGYKNSISVQRAWAEYMTPIGQLRFGRMANQWGLGMLANSGDCLDCDFQSNADRILFATGLKSIDLYVAGMWDFVSSGPTNASPYDVYGGQPYNTANLTNVGQWGLAVVRRVNPDLQRLKLSRGDLVINGGVFSVYRKQTLDVRAGQNPLTGVDVNVANNGLERRGAEAIIPDFWLQILWNKLRLEAEFAAVYGSAENSPARNSPTNPLEVRLFGLATQAELRAVEDRLRIQFGSGWSSGDPNVEGLAPGANGLQTRKDGSSGGPISTFRFHPSYYVDYIFFRRILSRVQGAYYFRPSVEYDVVRQPSGQKLGAGAALIWSRASEFVQAPGNRRDLGVELDFQVYYQARDGSLNDDPNKLGGFYATLQYGIFFPMSGLEYLPESREANVAGKRLPENGGPFDLSLSTAQTVRLIMGVLF